MGVAHSDSCHGEELPVYRQFALRHALRSRGQCRRHPTGIQDRQPHIHADLSIVLKDRNDQPGWRFDCPGPPRSIAVAIGKEASQATDSVAAHLGFAAIGIEDPHPQLSLSLGRQSEDEAVSPHPEAAIADPSHPSGIRAGQRGVKITLTPLN